VVATPVGAVETIIQPGTNGLIVGKPNRDRLARGIARVLDQPVVQRMRPGKIRDTVTHCGWDSIAAAVIQTYAALVKSHKNDPLRHEAASCHSFPN
jgi:glycosyltransferase involved in cell wall biosynthesis